MTWLRVLLVCVGAVVLQLAVFTDVRVAGVAPELLALVAVLAGLYGGPERGTTAAFAAGLLWDVYLPTPLGVAAIVFAVTAWSVATLEAGLFHDSRIQAVAISGLATVVTVVGYALASEVLGERGLVDMEMLRIAAIAGVVNAALAPIAAPVVRWALAEPVRSSSLSMGARP